MKTNSHLYTETAECQDCYKCLRQCTVKAIRIKNGHAEIIPERCIGCGHCVEICPVGAKRVRSAIGRLRLLFSMKKRVIASLAPSYISEFPDVPKAKLIAALKKLGFYGVSETALGAEEVSAAVPDLLEDHKHGVLFSSACPTAVDYIRKYHPEYADRICGLLSPMLAHGKLLKREYGEDIGIVFIGPCIAKKNEADTMPELIDTAITFEELRKWLDDEKINPSEMQGGDDDFIPHRAHAGAMYPVDGGMIAGIKANCLVNDIDFMAFSGIKNIRSVMDEIESIEADRPVFVELLSCEGGCVNGPCSASRTATIAKRRKVLANTDFDSSDIPGKAAIDISSNYDAITLEGKEYSEEELLDALRTVGKYTKADELNCGGCGYDSCREFAKALLAGSAEPSMCTGYMRKLAMKKANALLSTMPSGVVIVDRQLRIVESNRRFSEIIGGDLLLVSETKPNLEGANLKKITPFYRYFEKVLENENDRVAIDLKIGKKAINLSVFSIEPNRLVGGIVQDITAPVIQKERIVSKARDVIQKNLETVQKIAYLLGENAADSEVILNSIIDSFPTDTVGEDEKNA